MNLPQRVALLVAIVVTAAGAAMTALGLERVRIGSPTVCAFSDCPTRFALTGVSRAGLAIAAIGILIAVAGVLLLRDRSSG